MGNSVKQVAAEEKYGLDPSDPLLNRKNYPLKDKGAFITSSDGRTLGYEQYGKTDNYIATVIFLCGSPGCRLFFYEEHYNLTIKNNIRVFVLERPGKGLSSYYEYSLQSYANDINEFVQQMKLKTYHVVGYSAGGPFASCYCSLYSKEHNKLKNNDERKDENNNCILKSCILISAVGPPDTPQASDGMTSKFKLAWWLVNNNQTMAKWAINLDHWSGKDDMLEHLVQDFKEYGGKDAIMIKDNKILKSFLISRYETEANENGFNSEMRENLLYGTPWTCKLSDIVCPVTIFAGTKDQGCTPNMAKFMYESITGKKCTTNTNRRKNKMKTIKIIIMMIMKLSFLKTD